MGIFRFLRNMLLIDWLFGRRRNNNNRIDASGIRDQDGLDPDMGSVERDFPMADYGRGRRDLWMGAEAADPDLYEDELEDDSFGYGFDSHMDDFDHDFDRDFGHDFGFDPMDDDF